MYVGIDSHKDLLAVAVVDDVGRIVDQGSFVNTPAGHAELVEQLRLHTLVRVGVECSGSYGRQVALRLEEAGLVVREVPSRITARDRRRDRKAGKNDDQDAVIIARITAREADLPLIRPVGVTEDLAALLAHRDHLIGERTRVSNRVHATLATLHPGYQGRCPTLSTKRALRAVRELVDGDDQLRADLVRAQLDRLEILDAEIQLRARQIAELVTESRTTLTELCGAGPLVAARILVAVGDPARYSTKHKFARANGTAPIPASSGRTQRHRLNPGGNRQLNRAIHTIALTQMRFHPDARAYIERKRKENKTGKEALRCLKRQISDAVYRQLRRDAQLTT
jgi:transposase